MKIETMEPKTEKSESNPAKVVSRAEWLVARKDLLTHEKELTRLRDEVSRHRRGKPPGEEGKEEVFVWAPREKKNAGVFFPPRHFFAFHFIFCSRAVEG